MPATDAVESRVTVADLLRRLATIAPILERSARESEDAQRLADASVAALREQGFFKLWWPETLGGVGADLVGGIAIVEALADVDTASAWNIGVGASSIGFAAAYLSDDAVNTIFADDRLVIAGQMAPMGKATRVDGGLRVSGRWAFGSGIRQATWVLGGATLQDGERSEPIDVVAPIAQVTVDEQSWQVMGLSGTGSCDYSMNDVFIPEGYWFSFPAPRNLRGCALYDLPVPAQVMELHAGFALGAARRSLREITELAQTKVRAFTKNSVAQNPTFQRELAEAHARVASTRLYVYDVARRLQDAAGQEEMTGLMLEGRAASRYATDVALDVATWAYRRGGGTTLRLDNPLQRIMRDLLAATQHVYVEEMAYVSLGQALIGVQP